MTKVILKGGVPVAFGGASRRNVAKGDEPKNIVATVTPRVVLKPGANEVSDANLAILENDVAFKRHVAGGHIQVVADEAPKPAPAPEADPRAKLPGESKAAYAARMKALDDAETSAANDAAFLEAWDGMAEQEQAAMAPTLTDHEKELLAARPAK